jgi:hypothetical protein
MAGATNRPSKLACDSGVGKQSRTFTGVC